MASAQRAANGSSTPPSGTTTPTSSTAVGLTVFAGVMMIMLGVFQAIQGVVALFNDDFYVVGQKWVFEFDLTTWGWIHLVVGAIVAVAGFFVFQGALGTPGRNRGRGSQHRAELHVAALLPDLEPAHHRLGCLCHLGAHGARSRHRRLRPSGPRSHLQGRAAPVRVDQFLPRRSKSFARTDIASTWQM